MGRQRERVGERAVLLQGVGEAEVSLGLPLAAVEGTLSEMQSGQQVLPSASCSR